MRQHLFKAEQRGIPSVFFLILLFQFSCKSTEKDKGLSFQSYIENFQVIELPIGILSSDTSRLNHLKEMDSSLVKKFILPENFGNDDYNPSAAVYYYGAPTLGEEFTSVIIYQFYPDDAFSHFYFLINYNHDGAIISTKTIANRSDALTWFKLDAKLERGQLHLSERMSYRDMKDTPSEILYTSSFTMSKDGHFEPVPFKKEILTHWDKLEKRGNNFVVEEVEYSFGKGHDKLHFNTNGNQYTLAYDLVSYQYLYEVVAFKNSKEEVVLIVKMKDNPLASKEEELHFRFINDQENITFWNSNRNLFFEESYFTTHESVSDFNVEYGESEGGGVSIPLYALISENGVGEILLASKLESLKEFYSADKIRIESEETEEGEITVHNVYGDNENILLTIIPDEQKMVVKRIVVYGKSFKTENNIGVGSSHSELGKAYKNTSAIGGEEGVMISVDELKNVLFTMDSKNLNWSPDHEIDVPGNTKVQYIIVSSLDDL